MMSENDDDYKLSCQGTLVEPFPLSIVVFLVHFKSANCRSNHALKLSEIHKFKLIVVNFARK
jgi:hypothetical protein